MKLKPFLAVNVPIRPLQESDRPAFVAWAEKNQSSAAEFYWNPRSLLECFDSKPTWGLWIRGELAAVVCIQGAVDSWEILWLATTPEHQGQGLMRQLIQQLIISAKSHGEAGETAPQKIFLEVHQKNEKALQLYASLGFCQVGRRKNYYRDGAEALVMSLKLK